MCQVRDADEGLLRKALAKAEELRLQAPTAVAQAKDMLDVIQKEKDAVFSLQSATARGGWLHPGDKIVWAHLEESVASNERFGIKTKQGLFLVGLLRKLVDLRQAMQRAVDSEEGEQGDKAWDRVAVLLSAMHKEDSEARLAEAAEEELEDYYKTDKEPLRLCVYPEVVAAGTELQRVRDVKNCRDNLQQGQHIDTCSDRHHRHQRHPSPPPSNARDRCTHTHPRKHTHTHTHARIRKLHT